MAQWYYAQHGTPGGPVETEQLRQLLATGQVKHSDLVWRDGLTGWVAAGSLRELDPSATPSPAAMPRPTPAFHPAIQGMQASAPMGYYAPAVDNRRHSGIGIASFIIGLVVCIVEIICIALAATLVARGNKSPQDPAMVLAGLGILGSLALCVVGVILGFLSLSNQSKRIFGILGLIINGGIIVLVVGLLLIGFMAR